jgi:hypothetical protein
MYFMVDFLWFYPNGGGACGLSIVCYLLFFFAVVFETGS